MDSKIYLGDYIHYTNRAFWEERACDGAGAADPAAYAYLMKHVSAERRGYRMMETSWREQRDYLHHAVEALPEALQAEVQVAWKQLGLPQN